MSPLTIYVAGPLSAPTLSQEEAHVLRAVDVGAELMRLGWAPYVPHLSWYANAVRPQPYENWMDLDFAWIRRCDAVFVIARSRGADREVALAEQLGITIYRSLFAPLEIVRVAA